MRPHGESILEIVLSVPGLPKMFMTHGVVCINGEVIPRDMWAHVRPKSTSEYVPINVTLHFPLQGPGRGGSGKSVIALVAAIALLVVTAFIAGPAGLATVAGFEGLAAPVALGITGAQILAGAVGIAGALAISALTAPPTVADNTLSGAENADNKEAAGASANVIDPGGAIPRVLGTRKIYPPLVAEPIVQMIGNDEFVEAVYALNGPHAVSDIRIDGASIDSVDDVEFETREGWDTDTSLSLVTRVGRTAAPNVQLTQHQLATNGLNLSDQGTPANSLPIFHRIVSHRAPDEMWLQFILPGGIVDANALSSARAIPIRIRIRQALGPGAWINLPEFHLTSLESKQLRKTIYFNWGAQGAIPTPPAPATSYGWTVAYLYVPAQTATPTDAGDQWDADGYFDNGGGGAVYLSSATAGASRVINVDMYENDIDIWLDSSIFPRDVVYEIEVMRGYTYTYASITLSTYKIASVVYNFFKYITAGGINKTGVNQQAVQATLALARFVSVYNVLPVQQTGFALIAMRARNRNLTRVSCQASGYVRDWGGAAWDTWTTTSIAAPHYHDILAGDQNLDPLDATLIDNTGLVAWRTLSIANNWFCDLIVDDMRTQDVLSTVASTSYARPYQSDYYGVTVDNNRSNDSPIQLFSRINSRGLHWDRAFARIPVGFIVTYRDEDADNDRAQTIVDQSDPSLSTTGLYESISYDGIINVDKVRTRARFDLDQANMRSTFYYLETDLESLVCRRGSLVGLQHDIITSFSGAAHILRKNRSGPNVVSITLDEKATVPSSAPNAIAGISTSSISEVGVSDFRSVTQVPMGIAIRRNDDSVTVHRITNGPGETDTLTFETPILDDASITPFEESNHNFGNEITWGPIGVEYRRMLVQAINPGKDLTAQLTLVDEAPSLNRNTPP